MGPWLQRLHTNTQLTGNKYLSRALQPSALKTPQCFPSCSQIIHHSQMLLPQVSWCGLICRSKVSGIKDSTLHKDSTCSDLGWNGGQLAPPSRCAVQNGVQCLSWLHHCTVQCCLHVYPQIMLSLTSQNLRIFLVIFLMTKYGFSLTLSLSLRTWVRVLIWVYCFTCSHGILSSG